MTPRQVRIPVTYKGVVLRRSHRLDIIVEDSVVIEVKAVSELVTLRRSQLVLYLKAGNKRLGILVNFDVEVLTGSIRRVVHSEGKAP